MSMTTDSPARIGVLGAAGRMGQNFVQAIADTPQSTLGAATERAGKPEIGKDAGPLAGIGETGVPLTAGYPAAGDAEVWIDFTAPEATPSNLAAAAAAGAGLVIGTTGLSDDTKAAIAETAKKIPIVFAPNMSVGVTLLCKLVTQAAKTLGEGYDIEIVETHHRHKRDSPSGTALRLGEVAAEATGRTLANDGVFSRHGDVGPRTDREIGMQTLRGGDVVGDHTVFFFGNGERVELTHKASSRQTFARGAVRAAVWLAEKRRRDPKATGLYDMNDVLGL